MDPAMRTIAEIEKILKAQKPCLAAEYGITEIGIFGSYVRGEQRLDSDLDVLIELQRPPRISLIGLVELEAYLSELLGVKVDIAIRQNLKPRVGKHILADVVMVSSRSSWTTSKAF
jgi:predicted nucleotidyltransferase